MSEEKKINAENTEYTEEKKHLELPYVIQFNNAMYPYALMPIVLPDQQFKTSVERAIAGDRLLAVMFEMPPFEEAEDYVKSGVFDPAALTVKANGKNVLHSCLVVRIVKTLNLPDGSLRVLCRGLYRSSIDNFKRVSPSMILAEVTQIPESNEDGIMISSFARMAKQQFMEISGCMPAFPEDLRIAVLNENKFSRLADMIADLIRFSYMEKLILFEKANLADRFAFMMILMNRELEIIHTAGKIQENVQNEMSRAQREFYLREQLRQITMQLGEETSNPDIIEIKERLKHKKMPNNIRETVTKELDRMNMIPPASAEYNISFTYVDWLLSVPWNDYSQDKIDVKEAAGILNRDHYGLEDVKERILEFLSVLQVRKNCKSPIICFVGPPGVGKTSLGKSIAESLGRKFVRMSLGGIKDEAEIRGHRRTYVGALPGRIIQGMKKAGTSNPVFMLDELDKVGSDYRGDPSSALLEVLDPEQNVAFNDHYLEVDYDLSRVMFIATANVTDTIPKPLLDRMEVIRLSGYTIPEKEQIAKRYLVPRQMKENGLTNQMVQFTRSAIMTLVRCYTMESGVRNLERQVASVCRKAVRYQLEHQIEDGKESERLLIDGTMVKKLLGAEMILPDDMVDMPRVGIAIGMAWTSCGGSTLEVEAVKVPGKGNLKLTGSLGDVMKESAQAAFTYVHSHADQYGIPYEEFEKNDFHIHVPDGATPKDGPSAGVTLSTALYSLLTGKPTQPRLSMTGEITLHGRVTPVGGIREKVIAALTNGITDIIMPEANKKDLQDVPDEIKKQLRFHFVTEIDQVFKLAVPKKLRKTAPKNEVEEESLYSYEDDIFKEEPPKAKPISMDDRNFSSVAFQVEGMPGSAPEAPAKTVPEAIVRTMKKLEKEDTELKKNDKKKSILPPVVPVPQQPKVEQKDEIKKNGSTFVLSNNAPLSVSIVSGQNKSALKKESDSSPKKDMEESTKKTVKRIRKTKASAISEEKKKTEAKPVAKSKKSASKKENKKDSIASVDVKTIDAKKAVVKRIRKIKVSDDDKKTESESVKKTPGKVKRSGKSSK